MCAHTEKMHIHHFICKNCANELCVRMHMYVIECIHKTNQSSITFISEHKALLSVRQTHREMFYPSEK